MIPGICDSYYSKLIGDISRADAVALSLCVRRAKRILEFGVGASSFVIHQNSSVKTSIRHVDTSEYWVNIVRDNLPQFVPSNIYGSTENFEFRLMEVPAGCDMWGPDVDIPGNIFDRVVGKDEVFDLIFIDGYACLRTSFALRSWDNLEVGGVMMFHDSSTKRWGAEIVSKLILEKFLEIEKVEFHIGMSNMVKIVKGEKVVRYDWKEVEKDNNRDDRFS